MRKGLTRVTLYVLAIFTALSFNSAVYGEPNEPNAAEKAKKSAVEELKKGKNYIETKVYTAQDDEEILKLYKGLRVADVVDGMDKVGLKNIGTMSPDIKPLWKDTEHYTHRIAGIALTLRYVPTNKPAATDTDAKLYDDWRDKWYTNLSGEPFVPIIRKGTVLVIEEQGEGDIGSIGSNNIMVWKLAGCVGVVTSNTARDTDEIITEKMPLYLKKVGRGIRPGRNELESVNRPIVCGGALVEPGDVIVADGEGVVVVPRAKAKDVAEYARMVLEKDKAARQGIYKQLGMPTDDSVK
jgi:regulator of RNase E activity RraA